MQVYVFLCINNQGFDAELSRKKITHNNRLQRYEKKMTYANFFYKKKIPAVLGGRSFGDGRWAMGDWRLAMGNGVWDMGDGVWVIFLQIIFVLFAYVKDLY